AALGSTCIWRGHANLAALVSPVCSCDNVVQDQAHTSARDLPTLLGGNMRSAFLAVGIALCLTVRGFGQVIPPPTDKEVEEQARRLDPSNDKATRLQATKWFNGNSSAKNIGLGVSALERCMRKDPDMECRREAVGSLSMIAHRLARPCPLA